MASAAQGRVTGDCREPRPESSGLRKLGRLWARHQAEWRDPAQIASQWQEAAATDPRLLSHRVQGAWWEVLAATRATLLVTREYEHLVMAVAAGPQGPCISYLRLPHPSGLAVDRSRGVVYLASTRNPNQVFDLMPVTGLTHRCDVTGQGPPGRPLIPVRSRFFPGCLYLHDLALIDGTVYANAVGHNAVIRLHADGGYERVWWPRCIETRDGPLFSRNHLQLNSIAAGNDLASSFYSASTDRVSARRPGHKNFAVDKRGVLFAGASREVIVRGLTRPHSARIRQDRVWVANSGYGEVGFADSSRLIPVTRLPGWTRGLCFNGRVAFVGTSRVIPRFRHYAPGLDPDASQCGVHALDVKSGQVLGSLLWPHGNQIFAIDWIPSRLTTGLPFPVGKRRPSAREKLLFYAFATGSSKEKSI